MIQPFVISIRQQGWRCTLAVMIVYYAVLTFAHLNNIADNECAMRKRN